MSKISESLYVIREKYYELRENLIETHRRELLLITVTAAILFLVFLATSLTLTSKSSLCQTCHAMRTDYLALGKSPHKNTECGACHQEKGPFGFVQEKLRGTAMTISWALNSYRRPIRAEVENLPCLRCHAKRIKGIFVAKAIRVSHREFLDEGSRCTECHNTIAHGDATPVKKTPTLETCAVCHNGEIAQSDCEICHPSGVEKKEPTKIVGPWSITHGRTWKTTHGMGNMSTCRICHDKNYCVKCHQIELPHTEEWWGRHGKAALQKPESCYQCHPKSLCTSCHPMEMPHPSDFLKGHSKLVKVRGKEICRQCHEKEDCSSCHSRHIHPAVVKF